MTQWDDPKYPQRNLTDADIQALIDAIKVSHTCTFSEEERQIIKDMASGGKLFKKSIIYLIVGIFLWLIMADNGAKKAAMYLGWIK